MTEGTLAQHTCALDKIRKQKAHKMRGQELAQQRKQLKDTNFSFSL